MHHNFVAIKAIILVKVFVEIEQHCAVRLNKF